MNIINSVDIELDKIKLKKPIPLGNKLVFNLYYKQNNIEQCFIIQSPQMIVPYSVLQTQDSDMVQFDCCNTEFLTFVENINDFVLGKIKKFNPDVLESKEYYNNIKQKEFGNVIRIKINNSSEISVYDQFANLISFDKLKADKTVQIIFHIKWVWVSKCYYGIDYSVIQIKLIMIPREVMFEPDNIPISENKNCFEKYDKMLKMKIPSGAVESKMKLDGLSCNVIDSFFSNCNFNKNVPSKPSFLNQIKHKDFQLKKISSPNGNINKKDQIFQKMSRYVDISKKVPSLDDILNARSKLKEIKLNITRDDVM